MRMPPGPAQYGPAQHGPADWWCRAVLLLGLTVLALSGCHHAQPDNPDWIIRGKLIFLSEDLASERAPLPLATFRLFCPYIAGDIYGPPTTGELVNPTVGPDYRFEMNLNRTQAALLASLQPTELSLSYLHIEPGEARIARLAPLALQADGIEPVGRTQWVDADTRQPLLLLYVDRPARIFGRSGAGARPVRYAIQVTAPGYVWVGRQAGADEDVYAVTPKPARLFLAVTPLPTDPLINPSPARTDSPAR
jgi:hypothetical protein